MIKNELNNNMAAELHIPISHLDSSRIHCAPALSLSLPSISGETEEEKWSMSKRSMKAEQKVKRKKT